MINIVCFGDSNTFGYIPNGARYDKNTRWTGILQNLLGNEYNVIEEGLNGRTTIYNREEEPERNGYNALNVILHSQEPIDYIIVMLGTNDTKVYYDVSIEGIVFGIEKIINYILKFPYSYQSNPPKIVLISPILIREDIVDPGCFELSSALKSKEFANAYLEVAKKYNLIYLDASKHAKPSLIDGLHMDKDGHEKLAKAIYEVF